MLQHLIHYSLRETVVLLVFLGLEYS